MNLQECLEQNEQMRLALSEQQDKKDQLVLRVEWLERLLQQHGIPEREWKQ